VQIGSKVIADSIVATDTQSM